MNYEILHKGVNIADSIKVSKCYSSDRYGGMLDDLTIEFAVENHNIAFYENDELAIKTSGGFETGTMYLDSCIGNDGRFAIKALSYKQKSKKRKSKMWQCVKLSKIIGDVAKNSDLETLLYGVEDYTYQSVAQVNETDLQLLARLCKREGYSVKCDDGNLIVFNEYYLENNSTAISISKSDVNGNYSFSRSLNGLSSMTVGYFNILTKKTLSYTATDSDISGGEDNRIEFLSDIGEAQRFAKGYLRDANKNYITGIIEMPFNKNISAGTVADLTGFDEFDERYVVYEVRHDYVKEQTAIKVRKILSY